VKKGDKAGKLECWRRMPVQPVSAMRGDRGAIARAESGERDLETGAKDNAENVEGAAPDRGGEMGGGVGKSKGLVKRGG
jgi:hypothetical protein